MPLQLVVGPAKPGFSQKLAKIDLYCSITGKTHQECVLEALDDYLSVVVEAKLSQVDNIKQAQVV